MKIDWIAKLTSRKFWLALVGFVTPLILMFGGSDALAGKIVAVIMSVATLIAYIIGEGLVDAARINATNMYTVDRIEIAPTEDGGDE